MNDNTPLILAEIQAGKTTRQITAQLGCKDTDVWAIARQHNLKLSRTRKGKQKCVVNLVDYMGRRRKSIVPEPVRRFAGLFDAKSLVFTGDPATHTITITKGEPHAQ